MDQIYVHVVLPTAVGAWIYVALRSTDLLVFDWLDAAGMTGWMLVLIWNFQAGYCTHYPMVAYAFTSWMLLIWGRFTPWVFAGLAMALAGEFGQRYLRHRRCSFLRSWFFVGWSNCAITFIRFAVLVMVQRSVVPIVVKQTPQLEYHVD